MKQNINLSEVKVKSSDYTQSKFWDDYIYEDGGFEEQCCFVCDYLGQELTIYFNLVVKGRFHQIKGDYYTPSDSFSEIEFVEVTIDEVTIDDSTISVSNMIELTKFVQQNID